MEHFRNELDVLHIPLLLETIQQLEYNAQRFLTIS